MPLRVSEPLSDANALSRRTEDAPSPGGSLRCSSPELEQRVRLQEHLDSVVRRGQFIADLLPGIQDAERYLGTHVPEHIPPNIDIQVLRREASRMSILEFYKAFRGHGKWDFKQVDPKYQDFGNFLFGVLSEAFQETHSLPKGFFLRGAGWAQKRAGTSRDEWGSWLDSNGNFGDDPMDQMWIHNAFDLLEELEGFQKEQGGGIRLSEPSNDMTLP